MLQEVTFKEIVIVPKKRFRIKQEKSYRVHLQDKSHNILPIYIGEDQARAIIGGTDLVPSPTRPLTHDLFTDVLTSWSLDIEKVVIKELNDDIYFASLIVKQGNTTKEIDSRPSDAIALAVRLNCPINLLQSAKARK